MYILVLPGLDEFDEFDYFLNCTIIIVLIEPDNTTQSLLPKA